MKLDLNVFNARIEQAVMRRRKELAKDETVGNQPKIYALCESIATLLDIKHAINESMTEE